MKKLLVLVLMLLSVTVMAQQSEQIVVDTKDLPPQLVQELKQKQQAQQVKTTLQEYSEYAGLGKEIGVAVKEGLTAVKDVAVDFSKTDVGTFTMALIAWSIVGEDLLGVAIAFPVWIVITAIFIWSYRRTCMDHKVLVKSEGPFWNKSNQYELKSAMYNEGGGAFTHLLAYFVATAVLLAIIFH